MFIKIKDGKEGTVYLIAIRNGKWGAKAVKIIQKDNEKGICVKVTSSTNSPMEFY